MSRIAALTLALVTLAVACSGDDDGLSVDATGSVLGLVWLDRNGNGTLEGSDGPVGDVRVQLVPAVGGAAAYSGVTTANGEFLIDDVLVGDYQVRLEPGSVGDTLRILTPDSSSVTVEASDSSVVTVGLTYPAVPVDSARRAPLDTRLFVEGLVLSRWGTFGEASLHVRDSTGAIQGVRVAQTNVIPGDSVRLLGVVSAQTGQPVLKDGSVFLLRTGVQSPEPISLTTAMAATADDGALDADLIRLDSAVVRDTSRTAEGEFVFTVNDGSGPVDVVLDTQIQFTLQFDEIIGTILDVTGILVPSAPGGSWRVKPRSNSDLIVGALSWPTLPIDDARDEPADTRLIVEGLALNGWSTFGDSTVHVRDTTGAIRAVRVPPTNIAAGDSIRVVGTIASLRSQPVLTRVLLRRLEVGFQSPAPDTVSTATAAVAGAGAFDAGLIHLDSAVVQDTSRTPAGERVLTVDDGSGPVDVVLDAQIPFNLQFEEVIGTIVEVTGVLVPAPSGERWIVKPRSNDDFVVGALSWPTVTVDAARDEAADTRLIVEGIALNSWVTYGDSTVHVQDRTGSIRAVRMQPVNVSAGDSVRVVGTVATLRDQPVLTRALLRVLAAQAATPTAAPVSTGSAATAGGGSRDAAMVRVVGPITATSTSGDPVLTLNDGSGTVDVLLDRNISFSIQFPRNSQGQTQVVGTELEVTGLLVPAAAGTRWVLKPRRNADVVVK